MTDAEFEKQKKVYRDPYTWAKRYTRAEWTAECERKRRTTALADAERNRRLRRAVARG